MSLIIPTDTTVASHGIEIALVFFGIYSIVHSLNYIGIIDAPFINTRTFIYAFYTILGVLMITFYYMVIYTKIPIPKKTDQMARYTVIGLVGGMMFLIMTPLYILYHQLIDHGMYGALTHGIGKTFAAFVVVVMLGVNAAMLTIETMRHKKVTEVISSQELAAFLFIPVGWI